MASRSIDFTYLANERLSVEIALPGTFYKGSRFDWNGFITQVTLDGKHTFCIPESLVKGHGTGGCGLCGEFGIHEPVGFNDAVTGGYFPKIGVGYIQKDDDSEYDFLKKYNFTPYNTRIKKADKHMEFHVEPIKCNGYSLLYEKKILLEGCSIKVEYHLKNTGGKAIRTTEYYHNFIAIDGEKVGSGYTLSLPYRPFIDSLPSVLKLADNTLAWMDEGWENSFYCIIKGWKHINGHSWDLYNRIKGAGVREYDDFEPTRFALWGMRHVISPEIFIDINLEPEEELQWSRNYEFYIA